MVYLGQVVVQVLQLIAVTASSGRDTRPFTRNLTKGMSGNDVLIAQVRTDYMDIEG